ncbi:hypothetical protein D0Z08_05775 [Nocardioides immobilis]|uniref:Growth/differentiation factor n=1 Tax=Nocardioides immobilis TaxID=2049295 RepID=A0A417Y5C4_9ACTN|nr:hypothetical protein [Nocardioides immobilis]RHW27805.1 hypothetical protein D0Z08_05775 [Nocardioides immobilis]
MTAVTIDAVHAVTQLLPLASDDGVLWLLAAGPAGAVATYWLIFRYYRNTDKSHAFERDTIIHAQPVQGGEERVDHISKTRDKDIDGDNSKKHRERVQRLR